MLEIGDCVTFRSWKAFFDGAKTRQGREYLILMMRKLVEMDELVLIEVHRTSRQKWQVTFVCTESDSYNLEDDDVYLKANFYDTKSLLNAKPVKWYNALMGEQIEFRVKAEQN